MAKKRITCPFCEVEVNKENIDKHYLKVHGDLGEKDFEKKGINPPAYLAADIPETSEGKTTVRKRKPKKKDRTSTVISVGTLVLIVSLAGVIVYNNFILNNEPSGDGNGSGGGNPVAVMTTTLGTMKIELYEDMAPGTVENFINLANSGFYNGVIFHRVIYNFVIQAGGFTSEDNQKNANTIPWENTGLLNLKYTLSMARSGDPDSQADSGTGSSQFFINHVDNPSLDGYNYPYVVFAKVIEGFNVVESIAALPTGTHNGMNDWPDDPPVITSVSIQE